MRWFHSSRRCQRLSLEARLFYGKISFGQLPKGRIYSFFLLLAEKTSSLILMYGYHKGYQLMNSNGLFFWYSIQQCYPCGPNQYILASDNPKYICMNCPVGAVCDGSSLKGIVPGAAWIADYNSGQYILQSCPKVLSLLV